MTVEILIKYLHFICIFAIISSIVGEHLLLKPQMTRAEIKRLGVLDGVYGVAAIISIYPTVFINRERKGAESDLVDVPPSIKYMIRLELLLLFIMPLTASLMATGIGYFGK